MFANTMDVTGNETVGGTLGVTGAATFTEIVNGFYFCPIIDNTGATDISAILQSCFNTAFTNGETLSIGKGKFLNSTAQNWTNKPGFKVQGAGTQFLLSSQNPIAGAGLTILLCNTGANCIETVGSADSEMSNFTMYLAGTGITTPSTTAILMGRDNAGGGGAANPFCFQEKYNYHNINIVDFGTPLNTTANGGRGYIGIANIGAEDGYFVGLGIHTATPLLLASTNVASLTSAYQTLATGCPAFMTVLHMDSLDLDSGTAVRPNIEASGTNSIAGTNMQFLGGNSAILFEGAQTGNWDIQGAQESTVTPGYIIRSTVNVFDSHFHIDGSGPTAFINPEANSLTFQNNDFLFNTDFAFPLITNTATGTLIKGGRATVAAATSAANTTVSGTAMFATVAHTNVTFNAASSYFLAASDGNFAIGNFLVNTIKQGDSTSSFQIVDNAGVSHFFMSNTSPYTHTFISGNGSGKVFLGTNAHITAGDTGAFTIGDGIGGTGKTIQQEASVSTGSIGATTRTEVLLTWGTTMGDTNYKVQCNVQDSTTAAGTQGLTFERLRTLSATQVGAVVNNPTAGALTGTVFCTGTHP
jgi:hypothetical protein